MSHSSTSFQHQQPHNLEAERAVIASVLMDPDRMIEVSPLVSADDFYEPVLREVFGSIENLFSNEKPIDFVTVADSLAENEKFQQLGGSAFLAQIVSTLPTAVNATTYAQIVKEKSVRRRVAKIGTRLIELSSNENEDGRNIVQLAENQLENISREGDSKWIHLFDGCDRRFAEYSEAFEADDPDAFAGLATGFSKVDSLLGGLMPGHLMILAARPGMGKTALAMNIARNAAREGRSVGVFSLEMSGRELIDRLVAGELGVDSRSLNRGTVDEDDFERLGTIMDQLKPLKIYFDESARTTADIYSRARQLKFKQGLDLLIIDYLQLIEPSSTSARESRVQQVSEMTRKIKLLARELECPVVLLSQLNRKCEERTPPIPVAADLRESGSIEQDADSILMLYREGHYNPDCEHPLVTDVLIRKNRHGPSGRSELSFDPQRVSFTSVSYRGA